MSNSFFIALTLGMAAVTFLIRFSFIGLAGKIQMSSRVSKTLRFVPVTVLPAIINRLRGWKTSRVSASCG